MFPKMLNSSFITVFTCKSSNIPDSLATKTSSVLALYNHELYKLASLQYCVQLLSSECDSLFLLVLLSLHHQVWSER